jgi:hypothetical protein
MAVDIFEDLPDLAKAARLAQFALGLASMGVSGKWPEKLQPKAQHDGAGP